MKRFLLLIFLLLTLAVNISYSQNLDSIPSYTLEEVTINSGELIIPHAVNEIKFSTINDLDLNSISQAAYTLPSLKVQTNSRGETLWNLRGSNERQLLLFFDGINLTVPWDSRIDLSMIPTAALDKIKVVKGVPSVIYGPNSLFGTIKINSIDPFERNDKFLKMNYGSSRYKDVAGFFSTSKGNFGFLLSGGYSEKGNYKLPENLIDPYSNLNERINSGFQKYSMFGKFSYKNEILKNDLSLSYINSEKGVAPEIGISNPRFWKYPLWEKFTLSNSGSINLFKSYNSSLAYFASATNFNMKIDQYENSAYEKINETEFNNDLFFNGRLIFTSLLSKISLLKIGFNGYSSLHKETFAAAPSDNANYKQNILSFSSEYNLTLNRTTLIFGGSYDISSTPLTGDKPKKDPTNAYGINLAGIFSFTKDFYVQFNTGRKVRFPSLREMYSGALGKFVPNPNLKNETAYIADLNFTFNKNNFQNEFTLFYNLLDDGIVRKSLPKKQFQRINEQSIRTYGVEFANSYTSSRFKIDLHLTYLNSKAKNSTGSFSDTLEYKPNLTGGVNFGYNIFKNTSVAAESYFSLNEFALTEGSQYFNRVPNYAIFNFRISQEVMLSKKSSFEIYARLNNLFDKEYYSQLGLPEAGREFMIGIINEF